jgi:hypothetical protein
MRRSTRWASGLLVSLATAFLAAPGRAGIAFEEVACPPQGTPWQRVHPGRVTGTIPQYPLVAWRARIQGEAHFALTVDALGRVTDVRTDNPLAMGLSESAAGAFARRDWPDESPSRQEPRTVCLRATFRPTVEPERSQAGGAAEVERWLLGLDALRLVIDGERGCEAFALAQRELARIGGDERDRRSLERVRERSDSVAGWLARLRLADVRGEMPEQIRAVMSGSDLRCVRYLAARHPSNAVWRRPWQSGEALAQLPVPSPAWAWARIDTDVALAVAPAVDGHREAWFERRGDEWEVLFEANCADDRDERVGTCALASCATPVPPYPAPEARIGRDWQQVDAQGRFSFRLPPQFRRTGARGIDSYVEEFVAKKAKVGFDFGWYSNPLQPRDGLRFYDREEVCIDGRRAWLVLAEYSEPRDGWRHFSGVHFPDLGGLRGGTARLTMDAHCSSRRRCRDLWHAYASIRFSRAGPGADATTPRATNVQ